ncbi:MAG: hypothetical protein HOI80_00330 [Alphaproteobacteria bacterium]|jgi:hypothetical protein|nr:hypothetical protein [Candidatus Woesearchaeota archaeon]MBT5653933.1 hypothetical protein [Alphaproteobacteria bacterium]
MGRLLPAREGGLMTEETEEDDKLTLKQSVVMTLIGVPTTIGFVYLMEYVEGYEKSGWVWWPTLLGFVFSAGSAFTGLLNTVGHMLRLATARVGEHIEGPLEVFFAWLGKLIGYVIVAALVLWVGHSLFDAVDDFTRNEVVAFLIGGLVVYLFLNRNQ